MSVPTAPAASRRCWPLTIVVAVIGACVIVPGCLFAAIQLNAGYWFLLHNVAGARPAQAQTLAEEAATGEGAATDEGAALFESHQCSACHALQAGVTLVGPSLAGLGERAGDTVPGLGADAYVRESIVDPSAHVVAGFSDHIMPAGLGDRLTSAELDALVAYLLSH